MEAHHQILIQVQQNHPINLKLNRILNQVQNHQVLMQTPAGHHHQVFIFFVEDSVNSISECIDCDAYDEI